MTATASSFVQNLPDLASYRKELRAAGATLPLRTVPCAPQGLLASLPVPPRGRTGWPWTVQTATTASSTDASWPKITIVTPSFNQAAYLEETLRSVLLQNYPNLEYVVFDGGSTDGSIEIIERYRPWLSFARCAPDRGQGHAINLGFSLAANDSVRGWLNSDDFYLPGTLRRVAEAAQRHPRHDFLYGDALTLDQASGRLAAVSAGFAHERYAKFSGLIFSHAAFWRATAHQPVWEEQQCALDYELWVRLLRQRRSHHITWPLGVFREHAAAKSSSPTMERRWSEDADRNGRAHPELYRPNPWLDREHTIVQRLVSYRRERKLRATLPAVSQECGWNVPIH